MKKDWSQYRIVAILPLLAVVIVFATEASARSSFFFCAGGYCNESIPGNIWKVLRTDSAGNGTSSADLEETTNENLSKELEESKNTGLRYSGRITWVLLGEIYLFICIAALAVAAVITFQLFPKRPFISAFIVIILSLIVGLFLFSKPELHMAVFEIIFKKTIAHDVPSIELITNFLNSLGNAAAFSLLLTSCATLLASYINSYSEGLDQLANRMKKLQIVLYTGTVLLVATMLLKNSIFQWALAYLSQEEQFTEIARDFVSSLLSMDGIFYTLVLAAAYLPAAFVLHRRARILADFPSEEIEKEKKLQEHGMTISFTESLPRILAILGSILVGPVGELLNVIVFWVRHNLKNGRRYFQGWCIN